MNDIDPRQSVPPPIPPIVSEAVPFGDQPEDRVAITGPLSAIEAILRQPRRVLYQLHAASGRGVIVPLLLVSIICALIYGVVVGTFSGGDQLWAAPAKVAAGMIVSALICLPSLYVFSCLSGSRARLVEVMGLVLGLLGLTTILLIGFAPVAWVFSQSTSSITAMGALHLVFWTIATCFGWRFLRNGFAQLSARSGSTLNVWIIIFILVCLQMTTALRPIIGSSSSFLPEGKKFFVSHWIDTWQESAGTGSTAKRQR